MTVVTHPLICPLPSHMSSALCPLKCPLPSHMPFALSYALCPLICPLNTPLHACRNHRHQRNRRWSLLAASHPTHHRDPVVCEQEQEQEQEQTTQTTIDGRIGSRK